MTTVEVDVDLDSLGPRDLEVLGIPQFCPDWCTNAHRQAVEEGCVADGARVHVAPDVASRSHIEGETTFWGVWLKADPGPEMRGYGPQLVHVEGRTRTDDNWDDARRFDFILDSGSARVLARQLVHFADLADLTS